MLAQTCPLTTFTVVNVDARRAAAPVKRPRPPVAAARGGSQGTRTTLAAPQHGQTRGCHRFFVATLRRSRRVVMTVELIEHLCTDVAPLRVRRNGDVVWADE